MNPEQDTQTNNAAAIEAEADKDFAAGYASPDVPTEGGEPPVVADKPSATATTQAPAKAEAAVTEGKTTTVTETPDPWKDVPQVVRERLEKSEQFERTTGESLRNIGTTLQSLPQQIKDATAAATAVVKAAGGEAPTKTEVAAATKSSDKWTRLKEDYPDWAEAMEEQLADVRASLPASAPAPDVAAITGQIEGNLTKAIRPALKAVETRARQLALLDFYHDDWEEIARSEPYAKWLDAQPADVKALEKSPLAREGKKLFDLFKADAKKAKAKETSQRRLENGITPEGQPRTSTDPVENEDDAFRRGYADA